MNLHPHTAHTLESADTLAAELCAALADDVDGEQAAELAAIIDNGLAEELDRLRLALAECGSEGAGIYARCSRRAGTDDELVSAALAFVPALVVQLRAQGRLGVTHH